MATAFDGLVEDDVFEDPTALARMKVGKLPSTSPAEISSVTSLRYSPQDARMRCPVPSQVASRSDTALLRPLDVTERMPCPPSLTRKGAGPDRRAVLPIDTTDSVVVRTDEAETLKAHVVATASLWQGRPVE